VQFAASKILARSEDHQVLAGVDCRAGGDLPLGEVQAVVGEIPAADVRGRQTGVLELDPVLPRVVEVGDARLVVGQ
jgi:hypothetical protein